MPRTTGLVAIAILAAAAAAASSAQFAALPDCNRQAVEEVLATGRIPNFVGCPIRYAIDRVRATFGASYQVQVRSVGTSASKPTTVIRQAQDGTQIYLYGAALPPGPAPQQAPAVAQAQPAPPPIIAQPQPAPPPPPPPPPVQVVTATAPGVAANPGQPGGEIYQNATFSILDAAPVEAGQTLIFIVRREGDAGHAYRVNFEYSGGGLTVDPPPFMRFEAGDPSQKNLEVRTATAQSGDGDNIVRVALQTNDDGAVLGEPRTASGSIKPPPPPVGYSIAPDGQFSRGTDLHFTVTRTGPLGPVRIAYRISNDDPASMIDDSPAFVEFPEGGANAPLVVPAARYGECATTVTVTLEDSAATSASAAFPEPPPRELCGETIPPQLPWLEYLPLILGGIALGCATLLDKIFKPFVRVHPSCTITPGTPTFRALEQPASRWPEMKADVVIEPGELHVTQPLPRSESPDG